MDWRPEWYGVYEGIYFDVMRTGMRTVRAGEKLAQKFCEIAWWTHERGRVAVELEPHRQALDLNALFPIPRRVLHKGFAEAGQERMWANWGVRWQIRRVEFGIEQRRHARSGLKPVAVFRFLSEDWSPWIALGRMQEQLAGAQARVESGVSPANETCLIVPPDGVRVPVTNLDVRSSTCSQP